jgi:hypothetical protein
VTNPNHAPDFSDVPCHLCYGSRRVYFTGEGFGPCPKCATPRRSFSESALSAAFVAVMILLWAIVL